MGEINEPGTGLHAYGQPNFALTGFATQNGGTTGGPGGTKVTANGSGVAMVW